MSEARRIILLTPTMTYRAEAFLNAAERLGLEVVQGLDMPRPVARLIHATLPLDFRNPERALRELVRYARRQQVDAIVAVDDAAAVLAARASAMLRLPHNSEEAATASRNKHVMRARLREAGLPVPDFRLIHIDDDPESVATALTFPAVVKPLLLSGSQGVIRADTAAEFLTAFWRSRAIVIAAGGEPGQSRRGHLLIETYIPGQEVAVEAIMAGGVLHVLAVFDKPDPLEGPFFEETIYVTPSRHPRGALESITATAAAACRALGLAEGPVHAELRINDQGAWVIEVAARSIGGLCSRILKFGAEGISLEELILGHAARLQVAPPPRERRAAGVMMIPIPRAGVLRRVEGIENARAVPGIEDIEITLPLKHVAVPLPEGASYLGFIFARGDSPEQVEESLRRAHACLRFTITGNVPLRLVRPSPS